MSMLGRVWVGRWCGDWKCATEPIHEDTCAETLVNLIKKSGEQRDHSPLIRRVHSGCTVLLHQFPSWNANLFHFWASGRGNSAEATAALMKSAGVAQGELFGEHFYVFELRSNRTKKQQLAADSQQMKKKCKKRKSERQQTEQLSHQDKANSPHTLVNIVLWRYSGAASSLYSIVVHTNPRMTFLFLSLFHKNLQWSSLRKSKGDSGMWVRAVSPHSLCHLSNVGATGSP